MPRRGWQRFASVAVWASPFVWFEISGATTTIDSLRKDLSLPTLNSRFSVTPEKLVLITPLLFSPSVWFVEGAIKAFRKAVAVCRMAFPSSLAKANFKVRSGWSAQAPSRGDERIELAFFSADFGDVFESTSHLKLKPATSIHEAHTNAGPSHFGPYHGKPERISAPMITQN